MDTAASSATRGTTCVSARRNRSPSHVAKTRARNLREPNLVRDRAPAARERYERAVNVEPTERKGGGERVGALRGEVRDESP